MTTAVSALIGSHSVEDNCFSEDGFREAGLPLDEDKRNSYAGGAAYASGYRLGERLIDFSRGQGDENNVEAPEYTLPAPGTGELLNIAFITPDSADDYAAEIEEVTHLLERELH